MGNFAKQMHWLRHGGNVGTYLRRSLTFFLRLRHEKTSVLSNGKLKDNRGFFCIYIQDAQNSFSPYRTRAKFSVTAGNSMLEKICPRKRASRASPQI